NKSMAAVKDRLSKEILYWDNRANELRAQEQAGKANAKINSTKARQRADELTMRMQKRLMELEQEKNLSPLSPVVLGGALIVPVGVFEKLRNQSTDPAVFAREKARIESMAINAVMLAERNLGYLPKDVGKEKRGYDIESSIPGTGKLRFIEVKGRAIGATTVTITKREIFTALNKPDDFILALVDVDGDAAVPRYVRKPFQREPDLGVTSVNYNLAELLSKSEEPR
ncbi:MAG TPA: DUF3883 domain-containing protein, partial [Atribacteraceae bacterium]|nr:DUF3883 domain-containing protein [Atribacteraceae bacterium]